jgi:hypothetical protein
LPHGRIYSTHVTHELFIPLHQSNPMRSNPESIPSGFREVALPPPLPPLEGVAVAVGVGVGSVVGFAVGVAVGVAVGSTVGVSVGSGLSVGSAVSVSSVDSVESVDSITSDDSEVSVDPATSEVALSSEDVSGCGDSVGLGVSAEDSTVDASVPEPAAAWSEHAAKAAMAQDVTNKSTHFFFTRIPPLVSIAFVSS